MKKSVLRFAGATLTACMLAGTLAGCGGKGSTAQTVTDVSFPLAEPVTLTALTHEPSFAPQEMNDRAIVQRIQEKTNVQIDWTVYVDDQFSEKKQLALSKKDLPDLVFDAQMSQYDLLRYAKDGTIVAVDELIDQYMPNLKKILDENPEYRALITAPDGHIYSFPWIEELGSDKTAIQAVGGIPWINKTWLDELGLAMPTTTDELADVLRAFAEKKPGGHDDVIPMSFIMNGGNEDVCILLSSFGFGDNPDHYVVNNDKQVVYTLGDEGIAQGLDWLHELYAEGLIDPEVFTHDYNTYVSKAQSGRYGLYCGWDNASAANPDDYVALPPLKGPDGNVNITRQNAMGFEAGRCVITGSNQNLELTAKWIDQMYEPLQSIQNNWGTYGDTTQDNIFELKDDNTLSHLAVPTGVVPYELRMKTNMSGPLAVLDSYYGTYCTKPADAMARLDVMSELYAPAMQMSYNYPQIFMDMDAIDRINQIETDLKPFAETQKATWIMNGGAVAGWDTYYTDLKAKGLDELLSLKQAGLDSYFANMA